MRADISKSALSWNGEEVRPHVVHSRLGPLPTSFGGAMAHRISADTLAYASELLIEVLDHAETEGQEAFLTEAFADLILDGLEEDGFWPDYQLAFLKQRGLEVSAWGLDELNEVLYVAVADFERTDQVHTLSRTERSAILKRLTNFVRRASNGGLEIPEHNPVNDVVEFLRRGEGFASLRCDLLTNRVTPPDSIPDESLNGWLLSFRVWDLETVRRARTAGVALEPIEIDITESLGAPIPVLREDKNLDGVDTYLLFMPGTLLATIYGQYGPRLLEQNVRSFLMARGKVNQGIRHTLRTEPERFHAYNNGITATASAVATTELPDGGLAITQIRDLQIVNGAQTTASIAVASRDTDVDIEKVLVQMKLAVVEPHLVHELVPFISKYANAQNAVSITDLSANHRFLRGLQEVSRSEWTPAAATGRPSKWYFERARGSYAVELSQAGTPAQQREFVSDYPKSQRFDKNNLALYENTWAKLPSIVCRGGQKNYVAFLERLPEIPDVEAGAQREIIRGIFRRAVAKAILFRATDGLVRRNLGGTYKRQVVAYSLAYYLEHTEVEPELGLIWQSQTVDDEILAALGQIASPIKELIISTGEGMNITEWTKKEECWAVIRTTRIPFVRPTPSSPSPTRTPVEPVARRAMQRSKPMTLAQCIESVFGEPVQGNWRRHRRPKWRHVGDSGVPTRDGRSTWHVFAADFTNDRGPYTLHMALDFPSRDLMDLDTLLPKETRHAIQQWLSSATQGTG